MHVCFCVEAKGTMKMRRLSAIIMEKSKRIHRAHLSIHLVYTCAITSRVYMDVCACVKHTCRTSILPIASALPPY